MYSLTCTFFWFMSHIDSSPGVGSNKASPNDVDLYDMTNISLDMLKEDGRVGDVKPAVTLLPLPPPPPPPPTPKALCECQPAAETANEGEEELQATESILEMIGRGMGVVWVWSHLG